MSALYFDILKDRLYTFPTRSRGRRSAQTALYEILLALTKLLAPILPFTTEEVWRFVPSIPGKTGSIHLADFPEVKPGFVDESLNDRWERIWEIRAIVTKALEDARKEKVIGLSLDAQVRLHVSEKTLAFLTPYEKDLRFIFIVSSVTLHPVKGESDEVRAEVVRADGLKCERCWNYEVSVGRHSEHKTLCQRCVEAL